MKTLNGRSPLALSSTDGWKDGQAAELCGLVYKVRQMSGFAFVIIRLSRSVVQCVEGGETALRAGQYARLTGVVMAQEKAPGGFELHVSKSEIISAPHGEYPLRVGDLRVGCSLDTNLDNRSVALRNVRERAALKVQEGVVSGFREFCLKEGFTEIHSPKIVSAGAEGGANLFPVKYFDRQAFLSQSPQFYKQMGVAFFDRVFEIGGVYRAERHSTARHLNEYVGLDMEMGYISSMYDVMEMETAMLRHVMEVLGRDYAAEFELLGAKIPDVGEIPVLTFREALDICGKKGARSDLDGTDEETLCRWSADEHGSEFCFVTHYPSAHRPFYAMNDRDDPRLALSFDLLFRGLEITTGGQRVHDYAEQVEKMRVMGYDPDNFKDYLEMHRYGMPPHGGLGIGLERVVMKLLGLDNIRRASLFPRDMRRITP